jgi:hypothetical protein
MFERGLRGPLLFFLLIAFSWSGALAELPNEKDRVLSFISSKSLGDSKSWLRLMHVRRTLSGTESDMDGSRFFLSPNGKQDPKAELRVTVEEFFNPLSLTVAEDQSPLCRFPGRMRWLQMQLKAHDIQWPKRECALLSRFRNEVTGPSVSLVFSSYYLNNPSSAFGHTFLRINKEASAKDGRRYELLDYGFNFAATVDTDNALVYGFKGMFGGFPGNFTSVPYYYKVREYNNHESRDLWEYELSLTPEEVQLLVDHLWEVGPTHADYWYVTENCSFHMLTMLEAANPSLDLTSKLNLYVVPSDTVKVVQRTPGLVRRVVYRSSVRTQLFARLDLLSDEEKDLVMDLVDRRDLSKVAAMDSNLRQSLVLDAALDLIDYRFPYDVQFPDRDITKFKNSVLSTRGSNPEISKPLVIKTPPRDLPDAGHGSRRVGLGGQKIDGGTDSWLLQYRFAFHDLFDPSFGYPESAEITMFDFAGRYSAEERILKLERLTFIEVISRSPWRKLTPDTSWQLNFGLQRETTEMKPSTLLGVLDAGGGMTLQPFQADLTAYGGVKGGIRSDVEARAGDLIPSVGPNLVLRWRISPTLTAGLEGWWRREKDLTERDLRNLSATFHWQFLQESGVRLQALEQNAQRSGAIDFFFYY